MAIQNLAAGLISSQLLPLPLGDALISHHEGHQINIFKITAIG